MSGTWTIRTREPAANQGVFIRCQQAAVSFDLPALKRAGEGFILVGEISSQQASQQIHSVLGFNGRTSSNFDFQEVNDIEQKNKQKGIYFKVSDEERNLIEQKMKLAGVHNMSAYIRKMCIDGYTISLQISELTECARLLRYTSNNVNQMARRVNSGGNISPDEVDEITVKLTETNQLFGEILQQLSKLK